MWPVGEADAEIKLNEFRRLLSRLPHINYATLRFICTHLTQSVDPAICLLFLYSCPMWIPGAVSQFPIVWPHLPNDGSAIGENSNARNGGR